MVDIERLRVPPSQLRLKIDPSRFRFGRTDEVAPLEEFIGQDRAIQALEFGLSVDRPGYNIFVSGLTGTGRTSAIQAYVQRAIERQREAGRARVPDDWCYVYNFREPDRPRALRLPAGEGRRLHQVMEELLEAVRTAVRRASSKAARSGKARAGTTTVGTPYARARSSPRASGLSLMTRTTWAGISPA